MLVYNTANVGTPPNNVIAGYYYWNGTKWISVAAPQGVNTGDMLYWNGTQWVRVPVGTNGQVLTLNNGITTWSSQFFYVGLTYGGGIIFYIDGTGQHGLIAVTSD